MKNRGQDSTEINNPGPPQAGSQRASHTSHDDVRGVAAGLDRQRQTALARKRAWQILHGPKGRLGRLRGRQRRNQAVRGKQPRSQVGAVTLRLHSGQDERNASGSVKVPIAQGQHRRRTPSIADSPLPALLHVWSAGRGDAAAPLRAVPFSSIAEDDCLPATTLYGRNQTLRNLLLYRGENGTTLALLSHDELQEPQAVCSAWIPVGMDRAGGNKQTFSSMQSYWRLPLFLPNTCP